jgi:hypothetical protein
VVAYRAYVPGTPLVGAAGATSLNVKLLPDCNTPNTAAQYAISIGGGAYTLGNHWVQANGAVGTTPAWQTAATWGTRTVTGLVTGTSYTLAAQARYSGTLTQPTVLGPGASLAPVVPPQPPQIAVQRIGNAWNLTWPASPNSQLQWTASLNPPVNWVAATNPVTLVGGAKSAALTPHSSSGYYRLILE